jgi:ABC-2 type transport system permease protein
MRFWAAGLRRYLGIYRALWVNSVARELMFKGNFMLWVVVESLWFALQLGFVSVIYQHTERIASWSQWQVVMLVGASQFIQQLFTALFLINCSNLSELVRTGRLDFLLLLPASTRFLVSVRQVDLGAFVNAASALGVMVYAAHRLGVSPGPAQILGFLLLCVMGVLIHYSLMFILATASFWTVRAQGLVWSYYNLFNVARLPADAFRPGLFKALFTFALPMLLVANVPVALLLDRLNSPLEMVGLVAAGGACLLASEWVWRRSVRHYTSASS